MFYFTNNSRGESLVSILVAMGLIVALFVVATPTMMNMFQQNTKILSSPNNCRKVAQNIIYKIQSNGVQAKIFRTPVDGTSVLLNSGAWQDGKLPFNTGGVQNEVGANINTRWKAVAPIEWNSSTKKYVVHSPLLIQSSINGLLSIYNSNGNRSCSQAQGIEISEAMGLKDLIPEDVENGYKVKASLKIQPYNLATGKVLPCTSSLWLRPYGNTEPPDSDRLNITDHSQYDADKGLEIEVFVDNAKELNADSDDEEGHFKCSVKERFHFDRYAAQPSDPIVEQNVSGNVATLSFSIPAGTYDPGTQVVCRSSYSMIGPYGPTSSHPYGEWQTCDQLRLCGNSGSTDIDYKRSKIQKKYNISPNCMFSVDSRVFDVVGNVSNYETVTVYGEVPYISVSGDPSPSAGVGYEVGGLQFRTQTAAAKAASLSGLSIKTISPPAVGMDAQINVASSGVNGAVNGKNAAQSAAAVAQAAAGSVSNAVQNASASSASGAAGIASSAAAAAGVASSAAASARAALSSAQAGLGSAKGVASSLGGIGKAAVEKAEQAVKDAEKAVKEAEAAEAAAKKAAEEARRIAEQKEQEERDQRNRN